MTKNTIYTHMYMLATVGNRGTKLMVHVLVQYLMMGKRLNRVVASVCVVYLYPDCIKRTK
jgi:hypothetical protein